MYLFANGKNPPSDTSALQVAVTTFKKSIRKILFVIFICHVTNNPRRDKYV